MTNNHKMTNRLVVTILSLLMLFSAGPFFNADIINTYAADTEEVATWQELQTAIGNGATDITITADLYAESTIDVPTNVTIKGKDGGVTIYQKKRGDNEKYDTMFKVKSGGDLTLGENLTLTGETGCAGGGGGGGDTDDPVQTMTLQIYEGDSAVNNYYIALVPSNSNTIGYDDRSKAVTVEVYSDRTIKYNGNYLGRITKGDDQLYAFDSTISADKAVKLTNASGGPGTDEAPIVPVTEGTSYRLIDGTTGYLGYSEESGLIEPLSMPNSYELKARSVEPYQSSESDDQGCDTPGCGTYTDDNFGSGESIDKPKGFFVQVDGGKATLNGATLTNFITSREKDNTPKFVAPVAVVGGTFDIEGGNIINNIVGYIVKDSKANENANAIKMYVKGAAPNAQRASGSLRRGPMADIDDRQAGSGITATAGAVIYTKGAQGTVSGGNISLNRGDTGGIMASGDETKVTLKDDIDINNNVGVQFGGGVTTEDGAFIAMEGGSINQNVAWFGGGAVYATENGVKWLLGEKTIEQRETGWFTMDGGALDGNTSFTRGGAILADSDGVSLIKGKITNNMARMLGGAIYVMGDHPDFTYTVYIAKGYVHENKAVSGGYKGTNPQSPVPDIDQESNLKLSRKLNAPNGCIQADEIDEQKLFEGYMETNSDDTVDGYPDNQKDSTDGTGGGVWLCSYGNTTLDLSSESEFYVNENTATGSVRSNPISGPGKGGDDLHKDTKNNGSIVITGIDANDNWVDQNSKQKFTSPDGSTNSVKDTAMRNLINNGNTPGNDSPAGYDPASYDGADFYGNLSRRGGALAADGSFVFGKTQDLAQLFAEMSIKKNWTAGITKQDIVLKVFVETDDDKVEFAEVPLTRAGTPSSELDVVFDEGNYEGRLMLPAFVEKRDASDKIVGMIPVFDIKLDGRKIDLESVKDLADLADAIDKDQEDRVEFSSEGRKITFEEYIKDKDGKLVKTDQFQLSPAKISLGELGASIKTVIQKQTNGDETEVVKASFPELKFNANITNDKPAEIEKFVNQAVHKPISLDEVFTYDIVAYVKQDADKLVITDTLVDDLEFVSDKWDVKLYDLGTDNNHKPTNDVNGKKVNNDASVSGGSVMSDTATVHYYNQVLREINISGQTLTVTLANLLEFDEQGNYQKNADTNQLLTPLRGHWLRVSFRAQIKKEYQDKINAGTMKLSDLQNVKIKADDVFKPENSIYGEDENRPTPNVGNKPVESEEDHDGIINTASYAIDVANEAAYKDESNTVTVKPEKPEVEKYVNQAVHKDIDLDEVFTYDIIGYISKDADKVVFEDELVSDLEFVDTDEITVKYLDSNNHKPKNDTNGKEINDDASVASENWEDVETSEGALEIKADKSSGKLTVTIDDLAETAPDGAVIDRKRQTVYKLRGKYVKVTFKARIKESIQDDIKAGKKSIADLSNVKVKGNENNPVLSDEAHDGIVNDANLSIYVGNHPKHELSSNKVTVKPEQPEDEKSSGTPKLKIKKTSDAKNAKPGDEIPYTITLTNSGSADAKDVVITDTMDDNLTYISDDWDGINEGQTITWTVDVPAGMSLEINLLCRIDKDASGKVVNNAKISNVDAEYVDVENDDCEIVLSAYENEGGADTGDETKAMPWILMLIASAAAVTTGAVYRRKRSR